MIREGNSSDLNTKYRKDGTPCFCSHHRQSCKSSIKSKNPKISSFITESFEDSSLNKFLYLTISLLISLSNFSFKISSKISDNLKLTSNFDPSEVSLKSFASSWRILN